MNESTSSDLFTALLYLATSDEESLLVSMMKSQHVIRLLLDGLASPIREEL